MSRKLLVNNIKTESLIWNASEGMPNVDDISINKIGDSPTISLSEGYLYLNSDVSDTSQRINLNILKTKSDNFTLSFTVKQVPSSANNYAHGYRIFAMNKSNFGVIFGCRTAGVFFNYTNRDLYGAWISSSSSKVDNTIKIDFKGDVADIYLNDMLVVENQVLQDMSTGANRPDDLYNGIKVSETGLKIKQIELIYK